MYTHTKAYSYNEPIGNGRHKQLLCCYDAIIMIIYSLPALEDVAKNRPLAILLHAIDLRDYIIL